MRSEEPEQIELPCREHDLVAGLSHLACVSVEHHVSEGDAAPRLGLRRGAAEQRTDTGRELPGRERLGDVVVRAELQTDDAIHFLAACRQQDDRQRRARADGAAEREPVLAREHDVEDHEVELLFSEQLVGAVSVFGDERAMAVPLEVADDDVADDRVVVHDEDGRHVAHCASVGHFAWCSRAQSSRTVPTVIPRRAWRVDGWMTARYR